MPRPRGTRRRRRAKNSAKWTELKTIAIACRLGSRPCSAMNASSDRRDALVPVAVRWTVVAKNGFRASARNRGSRSSTGSPQRGERDSEALGGAVDAQSATERLDDGAKPVELRRIELKARGHEHDGGSRASSGGLGASASSTDRDTSSPLGMNAGGCSRYVATGRSGVGDRPRRSAKLPHALPRRPAARCCGARRGAASARSRRALPPSRDRARLEPPRRVEGLDGVVGDEGRHQHQVGLERRRRRAGRRAAPRPGRSPARRR